MAEKLSETDFITLKDFGGRLKTLLKSLNITQKKFAKEIEVAPYTVSLWVNGKANITLTSLYKIIDYFHDSYPNHKAVLSLFPELVKKEYTNIIKEQHKYAVNRMSGMPMELKIAILKQLGITNWYELFSPPLSKGRKYNP